MRSALDFQQIACFVRHSTWKSVKFCIERVYGRGIPQNRNIKVSGTRVHSGGRYGILAAGAIAKFDPQELPNAAFLSPSRNSCRLFFVEWVERGINQPAGVQPCSNGLMGV